VATACKLRFNVPGSPSLPADVKQRLVKLAGSRMTEDGILIIEAKRYRTQEQNRLDAFARLSALVQKALVPPKPRKEVVLAAGPGRAREKIHRSKIKQLRRGPDWED
jgi:ribosome-associated protein